MSFVDRFWHKWLKRPYKLRVTDHGGDGPTIIFLHGIAASSDKWSELIPLLKDSYRCITIDLLGFGTSPKPQWNNYTMEDHIRAIRKTIASLWLLDDFILVGHSLGSLLATRYAREYPERVSRLLLLSSPVYPPLAGIDSSIAKQRTALFLKLYKFLRSNHRMTPENFKRLSLILPLPKSVIHNPETWEPFRRTLEHCIEQQTILQDIVDIKVPIDMFYGMLDQVLVPYNIKQIAEIQDVTIHQVPLADHDIGKRYARAVGEFLRTLDTD